MIKNLKAEINKINIEVERLINERIRLRQELAETIAEFKVGDRVTWEGSKSVYEVRRVKLITLAGRDRVEYYGAKIKKDGTLSLRREWIYYPMKKLVLAE